MTTLEMTAETFTNETAVNTTRPSFAQFREWVMGVVHGTKYSEGATTTNSTFYMQGEMTPSFRDTHLPRDVKNYVVDYPFGD